MGNSPANATVTLSNSPSNEDPLSLNQKKSSISEVLGTKPLQRAELKLTSPRTPFKSPKNQIQPDFAKRKIQRSKTNIEPGSIKICSKCLSKIPCYHTSDGKFQKASLSPEINVDASPSTYRRSYTNRASFKALTYATLEHEETNIAKLEIKLPEIVSPKGIKKSIGGSPSIVDELRDQEIKCQRRQEILIEKKEQEYEKIVEERKHEEIIRKDTIRRLETLNLNKEKQLRELEGKIKKSKDYLKNSIKGEGKYAKGMWALI
ncbi:unnamed protein product [Blepharisma stoltei]|uniref:Uncharacterized protein n=1 Tax=Blepharisma stoltei TaxID=1481888 RepID=A0AAU9K003_9CILI|nr:unnamed protein product [Blepharisma stoltei]